MYYILDENKNPVPVGLDILKWGIWFGDLENRKVKQDHIENYFISTVFLGIDYGYALDEKPVLFETMVFNDQDEEIYIDQSSTWDEALRSHEKAVKWVKEGCKINDN